MSKRAVLFIHGFSAKQEDNQVFVKFMEQKRQIDFHTFILPGHEKNEWERQPIKIGLMHRFKN